MSSFFSKLDKAFNCLPKHVIINLSKKMSKLEITYNSKLLVRKKSIMIERKKISKKKKENVTKEMKT